MKMQVTYQSPQYSTEPVTGIYVRVQGTARKGYTFKVFETATCWQRGQFYGKPGMGYTLREYVTAGALIPEDVKARAITSKTTERWK